MPLLAHLGLRDCLWHLHAGLPEIASSLVGLVQLIGKQDWGAALHDHQQFQALCQPEYKLQAARALQPRHVGRAAASPSLLEILGCYVHAALHNNDDQADCTHFASHFPGTMQAQAQTLDMLQGGGRNAGAGTQSAQRSACSQHT